MRTVQATSKAKSRERGFTLAELAIATAVLLFGVVAVMQLVPSAIQTNQANRYDTTSVVIAQHYLDAMAAQPLANTTYTDPVCGVMWLGTGALGTTAAYGSPLVMLNGTAAVNFGAGAGAVAGYNCNYVDPNSAAGLTYQVRWGVVVTENAKGWVVRKRFVVGVSRPSAQFRFPVSIDATVER